MAKKTKSAKTSYSAETAELEFMVLPVGVTFQNGTPVPGKPYCYLYNAGGVTIRFVLSEDPGAGCDFYVSIYKIQADGTLSSTGLPTVSMKVLGQVYREAGLSAGILNPSGCVQFLLVVTKHCGTQPPRVVAVDEFRVCNVCN